MTLKSISVVINARLGSTRVPQKLVRDFCGRCLLDIALDKLDQMDFFEHRFLAVAESELATKATHYSNIDILHRLPQAVKPGVNPLTVTFEHYLRVPSEFIFVFNPCLPCITTATIRNAFDYFQSTQYNSYTAVVSTGDWVFDSSGNPLTVSDPSNVTTNKDTTFLKGCHAFHIINKNFFKDNNILWTFSKNDPHLVRVPESESVDVDTIPEFNLAQMLYSDSLKY